MRRSPPENADVGRFGREICRNGPEIYLRHLIQTTPGWKSAEPKR
jgi:hypothetical protein